MSSKSKKPTGDRYLVFYNPLSGPKRIRTLDMSIKRFMKRHGMAFNFYYLVPGEAVPVQKLVDQYQPTALLVAGGDGTLRSVVQQVYWNKINLPVAFYPLGSANVFAMLLGVSQNLKYLLKPKKRKIYPGIFNRKRIFLIAACFGRIATVSTRAHKYHKQLLGPFAYLLSAAHRFWHFPHRRIHLGGNTLQAHSVLFCLADFTKAFLPNVPFARRKLTVLTFKNKYSMGLFEMIFTKGVQNKSHPQLDVKLAESIAFCGFAQGEVHLDGDTFSVQNNKYRLEMAERPVTFLTKK